MPDSTFTDALRKTYAELDQLQFVDALWARDVQVWTGDEATHRKIAGRLGWLGALDVVEPQLPRLKAFADSLRGDGLTDVVLLGMGGSSLAPEVLRQVLGRAGQVPRFRMLDSVDPDAVRAACAAPATTLFVLASKSGGTIEPNAMAAEAVRALQAAGITDWARRVVAITDEGTALHRRAQESGFREIFVNPSDIGGRYSALSLFGLVPAALMGIDLDGLMAEARAMEQACRVSVGARNPGVVLGAFAAAGARVGRDKLTLLLPERLASFGLWVEQLVAESTGKQGRGVVPITGEAGPIVWGADRLCVAVTMGAEAPASPLLDSARAAGVPLLDLAMPGPLALGAEFLRWELATAVMGRLLEVNPFDEPNVQQAKDATGILLAEYERTGVLPEPSSSALTADATVSVTSAAAGQGAVPTLTALREAGDYLSIMAYLPPELAVAGTRLLVEYFGEHYPVTVAAAGATPLFDPGNARLRG